MPGTSRSAPTSTWVKKETTGASGRSQTSTVSPFASVRTVIFFSKAARSWAGAGWVPKGGGRKRSRLGLCASILQSGVVF